MEEDFLGAVEGGNFKMQIEQTLRGNFCQTQPKHQKEVLDDWEAFGA